MNVQGEAVVEWCGAQGGEGEGDETKQNQNQSLVGKKDKWSLEEEKTKQHLE